MAIVLNNVTSGYNLSTINSNFQKIEDYVNDKLLARADTGVAGEAMMERALDMNGNKILNVFVDVNDASSLLTVGVADSRYYNVSGDTLTGPMDANSQIISNLPSPTQPSQPATKAYADAIQSDVDSNESRSLRFPEIVAPMFSAASRANSLQGYNDIGTPVPIFSYTDTADLALKLASTIGTDYVSQGNAPLSIIVKGNIFKYITANDRNTLLTSLGTEVVVDYALAAAIADGVTEIFYPPALGIYVHGQTQITLPAGFSISGVSAKPYTASSNASFNNRGTVIRLFSGATAPFILTNRHRFLNVIFDGRDRSVNLMKGVGTDQTQYCRFDSCGIYRWLNGIGGSSSSGYTATVQVIGCALASNYRGVRNVIDSRFTDCTINANTYNGVELNAGANNNSFVNVRNEWNEGHNYIAVNAKRNVIVGELIDRAGLNAIAATGGGQWIVSGAAIQRSGKNAVVGSTDDSHFYIEGASSSIILNGVYTLTGANDDGSGTVSPSYGLSTGGSSSDDKTFIASGCNLSGYGTSWLRSGSILSLDISASRGASSVKNNGFYRIVDGVSQLGPDSSATLSGAGNTAVMTFQTTESTFNRYSQPFTRTFSLTARNNTSTGSVAEFSVKLTISREGVDAIVTPNPNTVTSSASLSGGTINLASASPTGASVSFAISADGQTLTVTITAIDSATRAITAKLRG